MIIKKYNNMVQRAQRKVLFWVALAYKTVWVEALQVITGDIPCDLLAMKRKERLEGSDSNDYRERTHSTDVRKEGISIPPKPSGRNYIFLRLGLDFKAWTIISHNF